MNKNLIIHKIKIDWIDLINNLFNRETWGKEINIYNYKDININGIVYGVNMKYNTLELQILIKYPYNDEIRNEMTFFYIFLNNFSVEDINSILNKKIIGLINEVKDDIKKKEITKKLKSIHFNINDIDFSSDDFKQLAPYLEIDYKLSQQFIDDDLKNLVIENIKEKYLRILNYLFIEKFKVLMKTFSNDLINDLENFKNKILEMK